MNSQLPPSPDMDVLVLNHWHELPPPLLILAPPRSFTSIVCAMLGQHPQMYGLPETHLFCEQTLSARAARVERATYPMGDGLLRAIAQLYFGGQSESTIRLARRWLRLRQDVTTDFIFKALADKVYPLILVDKSPSTINSLQVLRRTHSRFPGVRFIHLLRHPRGHGESVMRFIDERRRYGPIPPTHWLLQISSQFRENAEANGPNGPILDPQFGWLAYHKMICTFLEMMPRTAYMRVRGEELLAAPDSVLPGIIRWLGLRSDQLAIDEMKHPERSPYAFPGPRGARYGNDSFFLQDPALRPSRAGAYRLEGGLSWREDDHGFVDEVKDLAHEFGYV